MNIAVKIIIILVLISIPLSIFLYFIFNSNDKKKSNTSPLVPSVDDTKCNEGNIYDTHLGKCRIKCENEVDFIFDQDYDGGKCRSKCKDAALPYWDSITQKCSKCPGKQIYEESTKLCRDPCQEGEIYDTKLDGGKCREDCKEKIFNYDTQTCLKCADNQVEDSACLPTGCRPECLSGETKCGCKCIKDTESKCLSGKVCPLTKVCTKDGVDTCCEDGTRCIENNCVKCGEKDTPCGTSCCQNGQVCANNNTCCDTTKICKDGNCCNSECCGGVCCPANHTCVNGKCRINCGPKTCDIEKETCFKATVDGKDKYLCKTIGCLWDKFEYSPPNENGITTCAAPNNQIVNSYGALIQGPFTKSSSSKQSSQSKASCTEDDCYARMIENGATNISYIENICKADFNCNKILSENPLSPPDNNKLRYCINSTGSYTGKMCPPDMICVNGNDCIIGYGNRNRLEEGCVPVTYDNRSNFSSTYDSVTKCREDNKVFTCDNGKCVEAEPSGNSGNKRKLFTIPDNKADDKYCQWGKCTPKYGPFITPN